MTNSPSSRIPLFKIKVEDKGRIKDIREIIVRIDGLPTCLNGQIVDMGDGVKGIVMGFTEGDVLALVLGDPSKLRMGKEVRGVSEPFRIPVGTGFVGRMVTALGESCDQRGAIEAEDEAPVFRDSPSIVDRAPLREFLETGTAVIDILVPLAKGQRQLIMGDRMTGKTTVALDAIIHQKGRGDLCIYCAIGKSVSAMQKAISTLNEHGALEYTAIIVATDNAPVGEQYLAPFSATALGDYFAASGRNVLLVFDDLTKHAWAYRQLSLLLDRPPGREAYPGDIFYVQSQLMERAGRFNEARGGGSLSFLGIAETLQGDVTGYIPSNLSSMCDGQVYMSSSLMAEGLRPAVDLSMSVSIVGGRVQPLIIKQLCESVRKDYVRAQEVQRLSRLQTSLSAEAERLIQRGQAIMSIMSQGPHEPRSVAEMVLLLYALEEGYLVGLTREEQATFCSRIRRFAAERDASTLQAIETQRIMTAEIEEGLDALMEAYFGRR